MKKCVLIIVSILTIAMSVLTMFVSEKRLAAKSLFLANVNALARDETGGGEVPGIPVPGPEGWTRGTCQSNGGNWNMSTMVKDAETIGPEIMIGNPGINATNRQVCRRLETRKRILKPRYGI